MAVFSQNYTKSVNTLSGQNAELLNGKAGGRGGLGKTGLLNKTG
jgi:hypothetical protein